MKLKNILFVSIYILIPSTVWADGKAVYDRSCFVCHGTGVGDAPILGNSDTWERRIAQGRDTLYDHAIYGSDSFDEDKGKFVSMPAKGGFTSLTDDEVKSAVDYIIKTSTPK